MSHAASMPSASRCARKARGSATKRCICGNVGFDSMTARAPGRMRSKRLTCTWASMTWGRPASDRTADAAERADAAGRFGVIGAIGGSVGSLLLEERPDALLRFGAGMQLDDLLDLDGKAVLVGPVGGAQGPLARGHRN